ncbi:MAG TPA: hypothetical protein VN969_33240, partial [Streptosporangiaceae bacterium]|nr:hypothetical protein [Streptosporangiaceae bacterium]
MTIATELSCLAEEKESKTTTLFPSSIEFPSNPPTVGGETVRMGTEVWMVSEVRVGTGSEVGRGGGT